jgi:hypothetical protein
MQSKNSKTLSFFGCCAHGKKAASSEGLKSFRLEFTRADFFNDAVPPRRRSLSWRFERKIRPTHVVVVAGVDEVGRGCWAGPVFAAASIARN